MWGILFGLAEGRSCLPSPTLPAEPRGVKLQVGGTAELLAEGTASKDSQQEQGSFALLRGLGKCCRRKATVAPWDNSLAKEEPDMLVCWQREALQGAGCREGSLLAARAGILGKMRLLQGFATWGNIWEFPESGVACRGFLSRGWRVVELLLEVAPCF